MRLISLALSGHKFLFCFPNSYARSYRALTGDVARCAAAIPIFLAADGDDDDY